METRYFIALQYQFFVKICTTTIHKAVMLTKKQQQHTLNM